MADKIRAERVNSLLLLLLSTFGISGYDCRMSKKKRKRRVVGGWVLLKRLGKGGNARVWLARRGSEKVALKVLNSYDPKSAPFRRFSDEVEIMKKLNGRRGVLPLLAASIPEQPSWKIPPWLAMPIAVPIEKILKGASLQKVVAAITQIAETLTELAEEQISHRDVKPGNLYRYKGDWVVGDFGLVSYPGKAGVTKPGKKLGPIHFIAPEMLNNPDKADGHAADVYSLAKTLWVLATGQNYPPPGEQRVDISQISLRVNISHPRAVQLDHLIERATKFDPILRPMMREIAEELKLWGKPVERDETKPDDYSDIMKRLKDELASYRQAEECNLQWSRDMLQVVDALKPQLDPIIEGLQKATEFDCRRDTSGEAIRILVAGRPSKGHIGAAEVVTWVRSEGGASTLHSGYVVDVLENRSVILNVGHVLRIRGHEGSDTTLWKDEAQFGMGSAQQEHDAERLFKELLDTMHTAVAALAEAAIKARQKRGN